MIASKLKFPKRYTYCPWNNRAHLSFYDPAHEISVWVLPLKLNSCQYFVKTIHHQLHAYFHLQNYTHFSSVKNKLIWFTESICLIKVSTFSRNTWNEQEYCYCYSDKYRNYRSKFKDLLWTYKMKESDQTRWIWKRTQQNWAYLPWDCGHREDWGWSSASSYTEMLPWT